MSDKQPPETKKPLVPRVTRRVRLDLEVGAADKLKAISEYTGKAMNVMVEEFIHTL